MPRPLPADPVIRQLVQQARRTQFSRRQVFAGAGIGAGALALAACSTPAAELKPAKDDSASDKTMVWANWPDYLDVDDAKKHPTLEKFAQQTGIKVDYREDVDDNNSYFAKVRDQLLKGADIGADTVCLTEWMVARLVRAGYVQELDKANIPNAKNLVSTLASPDFDPDRSRSLPWQGGFAGIAWNTEQVGELKQVSDLWKPELAGRVGVLSEMRDTIGLILLEQGVDISGDKWGADEFGKAMDEFKKQLSNKQIRNVKGNSYTEDLANGDTLAAICWSGDITLLNGEIGYEKFKFVVPETGGTIWNDTFVVPMGATHKANAEKLMNYYYEPEVAAEVAAYVNYVTPVEGAAAAAAAIDPQLAENQLIFPNAETLKTVHTFRTLSAEEDQAFTQEFQRALLGA
ncbi:spermidine/putrescine ABC transporter substrate-binding protein [Schumannella luteola]|uniref:Spermidine/putrescine transport system substrate-binding protein n=1 Tax=Schumannella luteola TaxID=472059 RepID=A0A852YEF5_9MICO|nr:spermidine/putrescine ABC transporter substrate-binding protein [Schumannella luteola]NYG99684.1 spermidine/putrescine transport system substrate-binding protein [Schumannella luteola]TPX04867.1 spermidine/putrescine ABC transporter substrate-binding protein [Schumannella luteola]